MGSLLTLPHFSWNGSMSVINYWIISAAWGVC